MDGFVVYFAYLAVMLGKVADVVFAGDDDNGYLLPSGVFAHFHEHLVAIFVGHADIEQY